VPEGPRLLGPPAVVGIVSQSPHTKRRKMHRENTNKSTQVSSNKYYIQENHNFQIIFRSHLKFSVISQLTFSYPNK